MLTDEGRFMLVIIAILIGVFASGHFIGWSRDKITNRIFDKYLEAKNRWSYWENRANGLGQELHEARILLNDLNPRQEDE